MHSPQASNTHSPIKGDPQLSLESENVAVAVSFAENDAAEPEVTPLDRKWRRKREKAVKIVQKQYGYEMKDRASI